MRTSQEVIVTVRILSVGNLLVTYWTGDLTVRDPMQVMEEARKLFQQYGAFPAIPIFGNDVKRPGEEVRTYMERGHQEMREMHRSITYVYYTNSFLTTSLMMIVAGALTIGTRGKVNKADDVEGAIKLSEEGGRLTVPPQMILRQIKDAGIPVTRA